MNLDLNIIIFIRDENSWLNSLYRQMKQFDLKIGSFEAFCELYTFRNYYEPFTISLKDFSIKSRVSDLLETNQRILLVDFTLRKITLHALKVEKFLNIKPFFNEKNIKNYKFNEASGRFSLSQYVASKPTSSTDGWHAFDQKLSMLSE